MPACESPPRNPSPRVRTFVTPVHRMGTLYHGDRRSRFPFLDILTRTVASESVDLVYLAPPYNSAQNDNAFFQEKDGTDEEAEGNREAGKKREQPRPRSRPSRIHGGGTARASAPSWNSSARTTGWPTSP